MIRRNTASQVVYLPPLLLIADGSAVTSGAALTVAKDGTEAAAGGTLAHSANGVWKYTPTQGETDAAIVALVLTYSGATPVVLNLVTTGADTGAVALGANTVTPPTVAQFNARTLVAADYATASSQSTIASGISTVLARLGGWTGTGINTVLGGIRALAAKAAGLTPADISTGTTYDNEEHSQEAIADDITAYVAGVTAAAQATTGTIVGFPSSLNIGDSYTDDCDASIHVFIRDENDDPITEVGDHEFVDADFAPELVITAGGNNGRVVATVTFVDASPAESYLKVQLPRSETLKAGPGTATMQCRLKWDGAQKTIAKQAVTWVSQI